jgi:uncharacterized protein YbdZ (MbtH family)
MASNVPKGATRNAAISFALNRAAREFSPMAVLVDPQSRFYVWPFVGLSVPEGWLLVGTTNHDGDSLSFDYNPDYRR